MYSNLNETLQSFCAEFSKKTVTVYKDNQGEIAISVALQIKNYTKHISIKYHCFRSFFSHVDIYINDVDTKEHIADIFMKSLDPKLLVYLRYNLNIW